AAANLTAGSQLTFNDTDNGNTNGLTVGTVLGTPGITGDTSSQVTLRSNNGLFISDNISLGGGGHVGTEYIGIGVTNGGGTQLQSNDHPWNNNLTPTSLVQSASGSTVILDRKDLNDPPPGSAAPHTIAKNTIANAPPANASSYQFSTSDFFTAGNFDPIDAPPGNTLLNVIITGLPSNGTLTFNDTTAILSVPFPVLATDIAAGKLKYTPNLNVTGSDSFQFKVQDNGLTASVGGFNGQDTDTTSSEVHIKIL